MADTALNLFTAGIPLVLVPKAVVKFYAPRFLDPEERAFASYIWDADLHIDGNAYIRKKWNLQHMPNSVEFALGQRFRVSRITWFIYLLSRVCIRIDDVIRRAWYG